MQRLSELTASIRAQQTGHGFAKYVWLLSKHAAVGVIGCLGEADRFEGSAPNVGRVIKSAVAAGTTVDAGWASELSAYRGLTAEFIEDVSSQTFIGKIPYVRVPFLMSTITETGPFSAAWVEHGEPIPMSRATISASAMLQPKKVAALDPSISATAARPASLTNGIAQGQSTGSSAAQAAADLKAMLQSLIDGGSDLSRVVIAMSPSSALHLSQLLTTGGAFAFPDLGATGGEIWRVPVAVTTAAVQIGSPATHIIAAVDGAKLLVADDGLVLVDASRQATLQFDDAPTGGATNTVSLFQTGARVVRLIRYMNFQRATNSAVAWFATAY